MSTAEIQQLSRDAIGALLAGRRGAAPDTESRRRRKVMRWPFPGTVELWIPAEDGTEQYCLATSLDLSLDGVGVRCDEPVTAGIELPIAIHEPEVSFHGRALVRHCTEIEGEYLLGLQFICDRE